MIKLFKKTRYHLMEKTSPKGRAGNTGKYFKYAVGEIVLVIIGILIALQISNLNEQRKERIKEQTILLQLKED
jgi:hypothetical protein